MKSFTNNEQESVTVDTSALATSAKQDTMITSLQLLDNAISGNEMQVDVITSALPTGASTEATLSTLSTDVARIIEDNGTKDFVRVGGHDGGANYVPLAVDAQGNLQVEIVDALPAGTNNIGDVDVLSVPANMSVNVNQLVGTTVDVNNGTASAGTQRVVIASDQTAYSVNVANSPTVFAQSSPASGATAATSRAASTALATSLVIKASAGRLYSLVITNTKTSAQFIQIHNTTSLPADTAVPIYSFYVPASSSVSLSAEDVGDYFDTGITVCNSSTADTKTVGSADCFFTARYL